MKKGLGIFLKEHEINASSKYCLYYAKTSFQGLVRIICHGACGKDPGHELIYYFLGSTGQNLDFC